jgi:hypothetical protein
MIAPENAIEWLLVEVLQDFWPEAGGERPPLRVVGDARPHAKDALLIVECTKVETQGQNLNAERAEVAIYVQTDIADLKPAEISRLESAMRMAVRSVPGSGVRVSIPANTECGYEAFEVDLFGRITLLSGGPDSEEFETGRVRRRGIKVVVGFAVVTDDAGVEIGEMAAMLEPGPGPFFYFDRDGERFKLPRIKA